MKKKGLIGIMTVASAVLLTSCAAQVPELSKFDNDKAAEYLAGEMLKYDSDYAYALEYDRSILEATPTPVPTKVPVVTPEPDTSDDHPEGSAMGDTPEEPGVQEVSGADILGIPGVEIQFVSYSVKKSYSKKYESIVASKGKELLILKFQIKNTGESEQKIDLFNQKLDYTLSQGDQTKTPKLTSAEGELQYFKATIASGKSKQGLLIFEVDQNSVIDGSSIHIINGMKQTTITLS